MTLDDLGMTYSNGMASTVFLIQHKENGYVHVVFGNLTAARQWIELFNKSSSSAGVYHIIERLVYDNAFEIE